MNVRLPLAVAAACVVLGAAPHELEDYPRVFDRDYDPMRPETRAALAATFAGPNRRLEALVGRPRVLVPVAAIATCWLVVGGLPQLPGILHSFGYYPTRLPTGLANHREFVRLVR